MKPGGDCIIDDPTTSKDSGDISFLKKHTNSHTEIVVKWFQAAQLTHERFLTIYHYCRILF